MPRRLKAAAAFLVTFATFYSFGTAFRPTPIPREPLTSAESQRLYEAMLARVKRGGPNHLHMRRLSYYAPAFAEAEGASVGALQAAALLHDATKEDGEGEPKERFCTHGEQGAKYAARSLGAISRGEAFNQRVAAAVLEHMGPCGHNPELGADRFMTKFCQRAYPEPRSAEARVLYDIDMLDLMTVDGIVKVVELRQKNPEFGRETIEQSARTGPDSAWKSVVDAHQTLLTSAAKKCGGTLRAHSQAFLDGVDFTRVKDLGTFKAEARRYLETKPLPSCLPHVPNCGAKETMLVEGPDGLCRPGD
jgi:hypothetical protein